ncbi:pPIWI_RE module domain-containing protein [Clostridium intestinale]|uniref:DUF3893 domain-containing protein n=1 Tax=Clostridium intestinale URNW TaxID=1294142 RepID=U2Q577_9CLOT|nr:DUF3962 domain-containing protein [Clostridium intestinale]ERK31279.1 hypothetical protein CINTURNW_2266 [Clostridium intestinale URNW]
MKNDLQLFSFVLDEDSIDNVELFAFKLPNEVNDIIYKMQDGREKNESSSYKTIYKIASTLFDKVIYCNNRFWDIKSDDYRWVYTLEKLELDVIRLKITEWLKKEIELRCETPIEINFKEDWKFESISLKEIFRSKKGSKYKIIPNYYIYKLSQNEYDFESLQKTLKFQRVMGEETTQMMTLPIKLEKRKYNSFSYCIKMIMKDPIDMPYSVLNVSLSVRIWEDRNIIDDKKSYLKGDESTSIYIYKENPYYLDKSIIFNKISIERNNINSFKFKNTCDEQYCDILDIDVLNILKDTKKYQLGSEEIVALVGKKYTAGMLTQYGAGIPERNEMLNLLNNSLFNFQLREPIAFLCKGGNTKEEKLTKNDLSVYGFDKYIGDKLDKNLVKDGYKLHLKNKNVAITIATTNENLKEKLTATIRALLRLNKKIKDNTYSNEDKLIVEFKYISNDFATHLRENKSEVKKERSNKIREMFEKEDFNKLKGIIVDIEPYHDIEGYENLDSKNIVRNELRNQGIINQFINYIDEDDLKRNSSCKGKEKRKATDINTVLSTAKDLISALGFHESKLYDENFENSNILIGVGKVSTSNNDTRLVISKIDDGVTYYKMYPDKMWTESTKFIFDLNNKSIQNSKMSLLKNNKIGFENWIKDNIAELLEKRRKVFCFVDSVLRERIWDYVKNGNLNKFDELDIPNKEYLRIIRINDTDEVPDYYIYDGKDNINKNAGIFKSVNNTYYLVGQKPDTDKKGKYLTKCKNPKTPLKRQTLYEINIQGTQSEEERDSIAKLTQKLRVMNITYNKESSAPLPLYCIMRISEYIKAELYEK